MTRGVQNKDCRMKKVRPTSSILCSFSLVLILDLNAEYTVERRSYAPTPISSCSSVLLFLRFMNEEQGVQNEEVRPTFTTCSLFKVVLLDLRMQNKNAEIEEVRPTSSFLCSLFHCSSFFIFFLVSSTFCYSYCRTAFQFFLHPLFQLPPDESLSCYYKRKQLTFEFF